MKTSVLSQPSHALTIFYLAWVGNQNGPFWAKGCLCCLAIGDFADAINHCYFQPPSIQNFGTITWIIISSSHAPLTVRALGGEKCRIRVCGEAFLQKQRLPSLAVSPKVVLVSFNFCPYQQCGLNQVCLVERSWHPLQAIVVDQRVLEVGACIDIGAWIK